MNGKRTGTWLTGRRFLVLLPLLLLHAAVYSPPAAAAIYRWDNGELITEKNAEPGANLSAMWLGYADFVDAQLSGASFATSNLWLAHLMGADLTRASFWGATLTDADLNGAIVRGASFWGTTSRGFTSAQLYSTASYQGGDLTGIVLADNDLSGWDFAGKRLTDAYFRGATLTDADLSGAIVRGANFLGATSRGFTSPQLYSTASYQGGDLTGIVLAGNDLSGWDFAGKNLTAALFGSATLTDADLSGANLTGVDFESARLPGAHLSGANLTGANFFRAILTDADLSGAIVRGASFRNTSGRGFSSAQFYSTASYQTGDLTGIGLADTDLTGWDLAGKKLTGADFEFAFLTDADLSGANLTNAYFVAAELTDADLSGANLTNSYFMLAQLTNTDLSFSDLRGARSVRLSATATTENAILPDGLVEGLRLDAGEQLRLWDYSGDIPIAVQSTMNIDPAAALRMVFEDTDWGSTISFEPGIAVSLDGSLELLFADGVSPASLIGTTFDLFDWDGVTPSGTFQILTEAEAEWDTSNLYTTGEVTLLSAVPEPTAFVLAVIGLLGLWYRGWASPNTVQLFRPLRATP